MKVIFQDSPISLNFFLTSTYKIIYISGNPASILPTEATSLIDYGKIITEVDWSEIFLSQPDFNKNNQILFTIESQKILISILRICEEQELEYIVSMTNLTKSIKQVEQNEQFKQSIPKINEMKSEQMKNIYKTIIQVAEVNSTILLLGESGVGKTFIAQKVHELSNRKEQPFISVNCGSLPEHLIESELFGYEAGSFTGGSSKGKRGLFEAGNKGTIFLDEIAELPYSVQSKLLNVLQEKQIRKIGAINNIEVDIRIIAATNKDLASLVEEKKFREDLFYRLNVIPLHIPSLKNRREEIPDLISYFLEQFNKKYERQVQFSTDFLEHLYNQPFPGNIRELQNVIERAVVTNNSNLPIYDEVPLNQNGTITVQGIIPLKRAKKIVEEQLIRMAYLEYQNTYKVAKILVVDQSTISKKMKEYKIN